jgi:hypothetical protein
MLSDFGKEGPQIISSDLHILYLFHEAMDQQILLNDRDGPVAVP